MTKAVTIKTPGLPIKDPLAEKWWAVLKNNAGWQGPYPSLERAQQEAARALAKDAAWEQYFVVELVGTVSKPLPDMLWHEPDKT
jgi:hypothetical protein